MVVACSWKTDGSIDCQSVTFIETPNGETNVVVDASAVHSPVNLMAELKYCSDKKDGSPPSSSSSSSSVFPESYWFVVTIGDIRNDGSISIGAVTPAEFQKGYKTKGMFYNGNLTNCSAGLKTNYGPYLKSGDRCVLECTATATATASADGSAAPTFSMTIYLNGNRVGKGFEIQNPSKKRFFPCVSVNGKVEFASNVTTEKPSDLLLPPVGGEQEHPLNGKWMIVEAKTASGSEQYLPVREDESSEQFSPVKQVTMIIDAAESKNSSKNPSLSLSVKVANSMRIRKGYKARADENSGGEGEMIYDLISAGELPMMTMMMAFPPYDRVEREMRSAMAKGWKSIQFLPGDEEELKIVGGNDNVVVARCVRYKNDDIAAAPLTSYLR